MIPLGIMFTNIEYDSTLRASSLRYQVKLRVRVQVREGMEIGM